MRFAYDRSGSVLACIDGAECLVYSASDEQPLWSARAQAELVAVGSTPGEVVAADGAGRLYRWEALGGAAMATVELGAPARALSVARDGACAVLGDGAAQVIAGGRAPRKIEAPGAEALALRDDGGALALGTAGGLRVIELRDGGEKRIELDGPARSIAWNVRGFWVAAVGDRLWRVSADGSDKTSLLRAPGGSPGLLACSADGGLIACQMTPGELHVIAAPERVGLLRYKRPVVGLAFGPDVWLGVGLDAGDCNRIDLASGAIQRSDPHAGRARTEWKVSVELDKQKIKEGRSTANPSARAVAKKRGLFARLFGK
jgi:hypothetical protein